MKRWFVIFFMVFMLLTLMACAGKKTMVSKQIADEVNRINMDLPQRINDNTTLERVSLNELKSVLVCHYTVDTWDRAKVVAEIQSVHLFCDVMEQKYRDHLFSMVDKIKYNYKTTDGWLQYAFVADKTTCK